MRIQNQFGNRVQLELVQGGGGGVLGVAAILYCM